MPMVSLKLMAGAARSMVVASARTTGAAEIAARSGVHMCARKSRGRCGHVQGEDRERPSGSNHGWSACVPAPPGVFEPELEMRKKVTSNVLGLRNNLKQPHVSATSPLGDRHALPQAPPCSGLACL
jgi:hypothetical protein